MAQSRYRDRQFKLRHYVQVCGQLHVQRALLPPGKLAQARIRQVAQWPSEPGSMKQRTVKPLLQPRIKPFPLLTSLKPCLYTKLPWKKLKLSLKWVHNKLLSLPSWRRNSVSWTSSFRIQSFLMCDVRFLRFHQNSHRNTVKFSSNMKFSSEQFSHFRSSLFFFF
jgi:hypothetical protein